ncbi:MAG: zinc-binding dehydrogenase [Oscillospiraceae bacterium]|nr:zinc-binding dehydrogenase [Oscillospiraceae bacterium]
MTTMTTAVRLYGKNDLRLEQFALPPISDDEILARVVSDSLCMSSRKAALQGADHKRVPADVSENPVIVGHEFSGELLEVGTAWRHKFAPGQKFSIQPALRHKGSLDAPGYSYRYIGGNATYIVIPREVMEEGCLLPFGGDAYFYASLSEPMSCVIGGFHASYHTTSCRYEHEMGIMGGGRMALLAGAGPMGLGAIDYAIHGARKPGLLVVTDIDGARLGWAARILTVEEAARNGVTLIYLNSGDADTLLGLTDGRGFDDVFVYAPVAPLITLGDRILGRDGCLNFFAGPTDTGFAAALNFYNVHYESTHIAATSGGNTDDMIEALSLMEGGLINPAAMITHVGGLDSAIGATLNLDKIPGGKKLIYTHIAMPLTAIADFGRMDDPVLQRLAEITSRHNGLWSAEAERYLLSEKEV